MNTKPLPAPVLNDGDALDDKTILTHRPDNEAVYDIDIGDDNDDDLELEIVTDVPPEDQGRPVGASQDFDPDEVEELKGIGTKTQQRIDKLRHEFHNEKRRANDAERKAQEALRYAQGLVQQNQQLRTNQSQITDSLSQSMQDTRQKGLDAAKARYQKAHEDGDAAAMADANAEMAQAAAELAAIKASTPAQSKPVTQPAASAPQAQQPQQVRQQPQQPQLTPMQQTWFEKNKHWFNQPGFEPATGYAYELDQQLRAAGVDPNTDHFYDTIVNRVRERYPAISPGQQDQNSMSDGGPTRQAPVAPAGSRKATGQNPRANKVRLTDSQVSLAKKLGLSPKEYAKSLRQMEG